MRREGRRPIWHTNQFYQFLRPLPGYLDYFAFKEWHPEITPENRGYYLMHFGNSGAITNHWGFAVLQPNVRDQINNDILDLLIVFVLECFDGPVSLIEWQEKFCCLLSEIGIVRPGSVKVLVGTRSFVLQQHRDDRVRWIYYPFFELCVFQAAQQRNLSFAPAEIGNRPKKFLHLIRTPRTHRQLMAMYLEFQDCASHGLCTWPGNTSVEINTSNKTNIYNVELDYHRKFRKFLGRAKSLSHRYVDSNGPEDQWLDILNFYRLCELELINETHQVIGNQVFLTEKTFRPLALGMPFLFLGCPSSLRLLRDLGYQTFPELIDESYDKSFSPLQTIAHIGNTLKKICDHNIDIWNNPDIVAKIHHNQRVFWGRDHAKALHDAIV
jgi:hypothetical protein